MNWSVSLCYLALADSGYLPGMVAAIFPYLLIRQYNELIWSAVFGRPYPLLPCLGLLIYTLIFGVLAVWGYRRDEGQHYH